jgi:HPt (histidine-containing phosphotransfer) domain-containing protein
MAALANSLKAAAPRGFYVGGNYLSLWSSDEDLYGPLARALIEQARVYEEQINENTANLERRASSIKLALKLMWLAPIAAIAAGAAAYGGFDHLAQLADWAKALR